MGEEGNGPALTSGISQRVVVATDHAADSGIDLFRIFDIIWALTMGGPGTMTETISIYAYTQGFRQFETSYTAAMAFLVIVILTVIMVWAIRRMGLAK